MFCQKIIQYYAICRSMLQLFSVVILCAACGLVKTASSSHNVSEVGKPEQLGSLVSNSDHPTKNRYQSMETWKKEVVQRAMHQGVNDAVIKSIMHNINFDDRVLRLDRKQPEKKISFSVYQKKVVNKRRIEQAKHQLEKHQFILQKIANHYEVPARYIIALWAIETDFGRHMGHFDVINALATLSYEGRRREFFTGQLVDAMKMIDSYGISRQQLRGSWAGAMGQCQFMPSSYLRYAADGNGDGKRDIWQQKEDVFASIANYLHQVGWDKNRSWGNEIPWQKAHSLLASGMSEGKTGQEWYHLGISHFGDKSLVSDKKEYFLVIPDKNERFAYLVTSNYKTLMDWNRSTYFATSVGLLADLVR
jgi:membrane-bound lytic murein transglycosylase B